MTASTVGPVVGPVLSRRGFGRAVLACGAALTGVLTTGAALADLPHRKPLVKADRVVVHKGARRLLLMRNGDVLRRYRIALGFNPIGPKVRQGDGRTPEGEYRLDGRNPESEFYRAIRISYPAPRDTFRAAQLGVAPGGAIMIHGLPNGMGVIGETHAKWDWTDGCIAVTNSEMDEIWARVDDGTPIEILP